MNWQSLLGILFLALLHWTAGIFHHSGRVRPSWLSAASGISVAYVFVHLLPDLAEAQKLWLEARSERWLQWLDHQVYLAALFGLLGYYALARSKTTGRRRRSGFWLEMWSFALYNLVIGILAAQARGTLALTIAALAYGAHLLVNDYSLQRKYSELYASVGRRVLSLSIVLGWLVGALFPLSQLLAALLMGILSGGIILNVMKEEMPDDRQGRLRPFVAGALLYAALLLAMTRALETSVG